jgi:hypothetical protein
LRTPTQNPFGLHFRKHAVVSPNPKIS